MKGRSSTSCVASNDMFKKLEYFDTLLTEKHEIFMKYFAVERLIEEQMYKKPDGVLANLIFH